LVAWRLAEAGLAVGVFDRGMIAAESSGLAAGHVPQRAYTSATLTVLRRTRAIVDELDRRTGGVVRYHRVGGLMLSTAERGRSALEAHQHQLRRWNVTTTELLSAQQVKERWPLLTTDDVTAGMYCPDDGFVRSLDLTITLGALARLAGAAIH
jgi:glycine/D-amino acid oxidase-like deaminating enzyme